MDVPPSADLEPFLYRNAQPHTLIEVEVLESGPIFITARLSSGRVVALQSDAARLVFGFDPDLPSDATFEAGYPVVILGYEEAVIELIKEVRRG